MYIYAQNVIIIRMLVGGWKMAYLALEDGTLYEGTAFGSLRKPWERWFSTPT